MLHRLTSLGSPAAGVSTVERPLGSVPETECAAVPVWCGKPGDSWSTAGVHGEG